MKDSARAEAADQAARDRAPELPVSGFQRGLEEAIKRHRGLPKHCAVNAVEGLRRAWRIAPLDPEIAAFRAINSEEEAATTVIAALQRRRYPGSQHLKRKAHDHKAGLTVFVHMLGRVFGESGWPRPILQLQKDARPPRIDVHVPAEGLGLEPGNHITPDEPLNLLMSEAEDGTEAQLMMFQEQLQRAADGGGAKSIRKHLRDEANLRNLLLYASDQGIPHLPDPDAFIRERTRRVFVLLGLAIIVLQTSAHQLLLKQALEAYLRALGVSHDDAFDYSYPGPAPDMQIGVRKEAGGAPVASVRRRWPEPPAHVVPGIVSAPADAVEAQPRAQAANDFT